MAEMGRGGDRSPPINPQRPRATLTIRGGAQGGTTFALNKDMIYIGRQPGNDVVISDPEVSRHHARLIWDGTRFVIRDLESANGTFVNGARITSPCGLHDGDVISLGEQDLSYKELFPAAVPVDMATVLPEPSWPLAYPQEPAIPSPAAEGPSPLAWWAIAIGAGLALIFVVIAVAVALLIVSPSRRLQAVPTVRIDSPPSGTQIGLNETLTVRSTAMDINGVTKVELWVNDSLYRVDSSPDPRGQQILSVQQPWTPNTAGSYNLMVKAYNVDGAGSQPASIMVNVKAGTPIAEATATNTPTPTPTHTPLPTSTPLPPPCIPKAAYVADITVPDHSVFRPGERIDKVWRIRNNGSCPWDAGYTWVFVSGAQMGAPSFQAVPATPVDGTADILVTMYAPNTVGIYKGVWQMRSSSGQLFGDRLTVVIKVEVPTPTFTPTLPPHIPAAPSDLVAVALSPTQIKLSWKDNSYNELGFRIFQEGHPDLIGAVGANVTAFTVGSLTCNTTYRFFVVAYNDMGQSASSNTAQATTQFCQRPVIHYFRAEPDAIAVGEKAKLSWSFDYAREAYLYWPGGQMGITGPTGEHWVEPDQTTTYRLIAFGYGGPDTNEERTVTIIVIEPDLPDLTATAMGVNESCYVNVTVANIGTAKAEAPILYVGVIDPLTKDWIATILQSPFSLEAGETTVFQAGHESIAVTGSGWRLRAIVDESDAVEESDEGNNNRTEKLSCPP
ncbi:MAG: FHA domain-containing protein [Anaerolineae bacterium]